MKQRIVTRAEATAKGLNYYFTGEPCSRGHIAERLTRQSDCVECIKFRNRERASTYVRKPPRGKTQKEIRREAARQLAAIRRAERAEREAAKEAARQERAIARLQNEAELENQKRDRENKTFPPLTRVAFDVVLMRPGSPRIQELMGCAKNAARFFPKTSFINKATPHMRVYPLDRETYIRVSNKVRLTYLDEAEERRQEKRRIARIRKSKWHADNRDRRNEMNRARASEARLAA